MHRYQELLSFPLFRSALSVVPRRLNRMRPESGYYGMSGWDSSLGSWAETVRLMLMNVSELFTRGSKSRAASSENSVSFAEVYHVLHPI